MNPNEARHFISELRQEIKRLKRRPPFDERNVIYTKAEMARTLGVSRMSIYFYIAQFPDFPSGLPTLKWLLRRWAEKRGIPSKPGPIVD